MRLRTGHNRLNAHIFRKRKLAPSPTCHCHLEDRTYSAEVPVSAGSVTRCVANNSPATHRTLQQQGGTGDDDRPRLSCRPDSQWRSHRPHSSFRLDTQCSSDREAARRISLGFLEGRYISAELSFLVQERQTLWPIRV